MTKTTRHRWTLGCIGAVSLLAIACSLGWYVAFVHYARVQLLRRARIGDDEVRLHRRRTLPGGDAFLLERVDAAGRIRWMQTFGDVTDIAGLRVHTEVAWVTLHPLAPHASQRLAIGLDDGSIRARIQALSFEAGVMECDGDIVETWAGTARRVSSRDGSVVWSFQADPRRMPYWPIVRGGEVIAFGRVADAATGEPMPPGDLPETWCQTESFIAWPTATGVALRLRGSRDVVALEQGHELRSCATTPAGPVIVTRGEDTQLTLLGPDLRARWTVPTPSHADVCNALVDGAIAQRVTDELEPDRWLRFDPERGATLDPRDATCEAD